MCGRYFSDEFNIDHYYNITARAKYQLDSFKQYNDFHWLTMKSAGM